MQKPADGLHRGAPLLEGHIVGVEELGDQAERAQRMPQIVDQHGHVVAALGLELAAQAERFERGSHPREQLARVDRLGQVRVGAAPQARLDGVRLALGRGQHDHRRTAAASLAQALEHLAAVHLRHRHVEQDQLRLALLHQLEGAHARGGRCARGDHPR